MDKKTKLLTVKFEAIPLPEFTETQTNGKDFVLWGKDNMYPEFLLENYEESPNHNSIVKRKSFYIAGNGFFVEEFASEEDRIKAEAFIKNDKGSETLNDILERIVEDVEIYGGFTLENIWTVATGETAAFEYIDIHNTRKDLLDEHVLFSSDWKKAGNRGKTAKNAEIQTIPLFDDENRKGKQVIYFREPAKAAIYYPKPGYIGGNKAIATDREITNYHFNEIQNGFTGGSIINFGNGQPTEEEEKDIEKKFKKKFTGTDAAGSVLLTFSNGKESGPEILALNGNDLDKRYETLNLATQQKIFTAHQVVSPMLFGIKTEGQLGGRTELVEALEIFNIGYVIPKQQRLLRVFNNLLEINGINATLSIEPIRFDQVSESDVEEVIVDTPVVEEELKTGKFNFTSEQEEDVIFTMLSKMGKSKEGLNIVPRKQVAIDSDDAARLSEIAMQRSGFANIAGTFDDVDRQLLGLIKQDPQIQATELSNAIKEPLAETVARLDSMEDRGLVNREGGNFELTDQGVDLEGSLEPEAGRMSVVYSYEVRTAAGPAKIPGTRDFCRRLIDLNRVYTRSEINLLNAFTESGNAWRFRGGWWSRKGGGVTTPSCRHIWEQHIIIT